MRTSKYPIVCPYNQNIPNNHNKIVVNTIQISNSMD